MYKYLNALDGPQSIKSLSLDELKILASEIRAFLIESVSKTGGHLASNLGVVELTIAMHYVFDSPEDHFVWDVSHQAYVHKILTGRIDGFKTLRQLDGLSGFTKRSESKHDKFDTGHSSTSISAGLGIALARDLNQKNFHVVSVIGDGALTGGMAFEALNHLGHMRSDMKVILNDNAMSISENVGGLSKALNSIRTNNKYESLKDHTRSGLSKVPFIGKTAVSAISKIKGSFKYLLVDKGLFFEDLGLTYIGPVNGHDLLELIEHFQMIKMKKGPIVLHVVTEKGKGYSFAENDPDKYHGVGKFNPETPLDATVKKDYSALFGQVLTNLASDNPKIVAISAAMIDGTGLSDFSKTYPERTFDVGICEQHAVTLAAGMATEGLKPFVAIYSTFLQRAYDQVLHDVCIQNLPVVFCIDRAGLVGNDGETHHGIFDISYLGSIPNLMILSPKDGVELEKMMAFASTYDQGPVAIRYPRGVVSQMEGYETDHYHAVSLRKGKEIAIVTTGKMLEVALKASDALSSDNVQVGVVNISQIKPMDEKYLIETTSAYSKIITLEDHTVIGGFGDAVQNTLTRNGIVKSIIKMGYQDTFVPQGDIDDLLQVQGLDLASVLNKVKEVLYG